MSTALYRRYRPETFADVIGQEHVTQPLMAALKANRITHAYLFSGPRGCGKTTSARILARCLNCAEGPTDTPCGTCDSCVELARGGPGSLDVVEIDAASHNGVDDARELRERAAFAPARDRYKIFILDEAHMVTTQGFNALLKLVEEPPAHVKFIFATTEPDKVIGTIRSRTHHYPFRLVPPEQLLAYLDHLAGAEGITVEGGVLPLVVRAGGGSVRDSLSVLDQLIAGADSGQVTYERAVALLGFTHGALLDDAVDALAALDGASMFRVVERVIDSGHAPRRFVEDLLERLRDLIVVRAAGESAASVLRTVPSDQLARMEVQAQHLGASALSRSADLVNAALTEMTGATSPRLQLELLCARLLLPAADDGVVGFGARLDRLEGAVSGGAPFAVASKPPTAELAPPANRPVSRPAPEQERVVPAPTQAAVPEAPTVPPVVTEPQAPAAAEAHEPAPAVEPTRAVQAAAATVSDSAPAPGPVPAAAGPASAQPAEAPAPALPAEAPAPAAAQAPAPAPPASGGAAGGMTADQVRRRWPEVLDTLARLKRSTWALISQDAQVVDLSATTLSLGFSTSGLASAFRNGPHGEPLQRALAETLGLNVRVEPVVADGTAAPAAGGPVTPVPDAVARAEADWAQKPASLAREASAPAEQVTTAREASAPAEPAGGGAAQAPAWPAVAPVPAPAASATPGEPAEATSLAPAEPAAAALAPVSSAPEASGAPAPAAPAMPASAEPPAAEPAVSAPEGFAVPAPTASAPAEPTAAVGPAASARVEPAPPWDIPGGEAGQSAGAAQPAVAARGRELPASPYPPDDEIPLAEPPDDPYGPPEPRRPPAPRQNPAPTANPAPRPNRAPQAPPREAAGERSAQAPPSGAPASRLAPPASHTSAAASLAMEIDHPDPSDPSIEGSGLYGAPLVARLLGGTVIDEITDTPDGGR